MTLAAPAGELGAGTSRIHGLCAWAAWLVPLVQGIWTLPYGASWTSDFAVVRDLGWSVAGSEGALSTLLAQLAAVLPVGSQSFRLGLVSVVALSLAARLSFDLLLSTLGERARRGTGPVFALVASLIWALAPGTLAAGAQPGGLLLGVALSLLALRSAQVGLEQDDARMALWAGISAGAALGEDHWVGLGLLVVLASMAWGVRQRLEPGALGLSALGALVALLGCALVRALPALAGARLDLGLLAPLTSAAGPESPPAPPGLYALPHHALTSWSAELGVVTTALGLSGLGWGLARAPLRSRFVPWLALAALGPVALARAWMSATPPEPGLLLLSGAGVAAGLSFAAQGVCELLWRGSLPFGRPASVLFGVFSLTLVLGQLDREPRELEAEGLGTEAWSDEALGKLPPSSLVLVHSPELALRLLAARLLHDDRPDVVIVPVPFLGRGPLARELLDLEPATSALLRQLVVSGDPDEYSLCKLADERPFFLQVEGSWEHRLMAHLRPEPLWLAFSAHPLGASDRRAGATRSRAALRRIAAAFPEPEAIDVRTLAVMRAQIGEQLSVFEALGERAHGSSLARSADRLRALAGEPTPPQAPSSRLAALRD